MGFGPGMVLLSKLPLHASRYAHQKLNPLLFETLNVNEYPKSGGTWICRMLRDITGWRFDDNAIPRPGNSIVKYHRMPLNVASQIAIVRDPRDVFVSLYFHSRAVFRDDPFNSAIVGATKEVLSPEDDEKTQIAKFIDRLLTDPIYPRFSWRDFYQYHLDRGTPIFRYEDFREQPKQTLESLLEVREIEVTSTRLSEVIEKHSIEKILAKRNADESADRGGANFVRRGKVGGFNDYLDDAMQARIEQAQGPVMAAFGYS